MEIREREKERGSEGGKGRKKKRDIEWEREGRVEGERS